MMAPKTLNEQVKVLIADDDGQLSIRLASHLSDHGFSVKIVSSGNEARAELKNWKPKFFLVDLMLPEANGLELIRYHLVEPELRHHMVHTIVMSGHNSVTNVHSSIRAGARDYMVKPFKSEEMLQRLVFHLRGHKTKTEVSTQQMSRLADDALVLHLTDLVLKQANAPQSLEEILFNLTEMVAIRMDGVRCSLVQVSSLSEGMVITSNDNRAATGFTLDLNKYPEISQVMNFGQVLAVENIKSDPRLRGIIEKLNDVQFNSIIVCPIFRHLQPFGVLSVRLPETKMEIAENEIRFVEIVGHAISLVLGQGRHLAQPDFWLSQRNNNAVISFAAATAAKKR